jgi:hypothetical protein
MGPGGHHDARRLFRAYGKEVAYVVNMMNLGGNGRIEVLHRSLRGGVGRRHKLHLREAVHGRRGTGQGSWQKANSYRRPLDQHETNTNPNKRNESLGGEIEN